MKHVHDYKQYPKHRNVVSEYHFRDVDICGVCIKW